MKKILLLLAILSHYQALSQKLEIKEKNGKYAFFQKEKPHYIYDKINPNYRGFYLVLNSNGWGVANFNGKEIIKCQYDTILYTLGKEFIVSSNNKFGAVDSFGKVTIPLEYDEIDYITNNSEALVKKENQWAFLKDGELDYDNNKLVFMLPERFPIFEFCPEYANNYPELKKCSDKKLFEYIESTIDYPRHAKEGAVEGTVVLTFIVSTEGEITDVEILRDPGSGCGKIAKEVMESMKKWLPAEQDGKKVACRLNLPIKFKLSNG